MMQASISNATTLAAGLSEKQASTQSNEPYSQRSATQASPSRQRAVPSHEAISSAQSLSKQAWQALRDSPAEWPAVPPIAARPPADDAPLAAPVPEAGAPDQLNPPPAEAPALDEGAPSDSVQPAHPVFSASGSVRPPQLAAPTKKTMFMTKAARQLSTKVNAILPAFFGDARK